MCMYITLRQNRNSISIPMYLCWLLMTVGNNRLHDYTADGGWGITWTQCTPTSHPLVVVGRPTLKPDSAYRALRLTFLSPGWLSIRSINYRGGLVKPGYKHPNITSIPHPSQTRCCTPGSLRTLRKHLISLWYST